MDDSSLQFVDQHQHISITGAKLPHWHQNNKIQFITFRLADSLPQEKLAELTAFKEQWLAAHPQPWDQKTKDEYDYTIRRKIDRWLDQGFGECILQREDIRQIVAQHVVALSRQTIQSLSLCHHAQSRTPTSVAHWRRGIYEVHRKRETVYGECHQSGFGKKRPGLAEKLLRPSGA